MAAPNPARSTTPEKHCILRKALLKYQGKLSFQQGFVRGLFDAPMPAPNKVDEQLLTLPRLLSHMRAAIIATLPDGQIVFWNAFATQLYGWSAEEVFGHNIAKITVPESAQAQGLEIMAALNAGRSWTGEFPVKRKDGSQFTAMVTDSPIVDDNGELIGIVGVSYDVTEARLAQEELRRSAELFKRFANTLPELCFMARQDGYVFWYNDRWIEYTGVPMEEMLGWNWQKFHDPKYLPEVMERWKKSIETGHVFEMEFPLLGRDGEPRWFLTRAHPFCDSFGRVVSWFGVNTNIDEAVKTREALFQARQQLEHRVRERTAELHSANDSLRSLSATLMRLRDEERRRIARDLHDSLGQLIAAARMSVGALRSQQERMDASGARALDEMTEMLEEMSRQTRTVSHLLHPPLLDEVGLKSALRWFVEEFAERSGIKVSIDIPEDLGRLSDDLEIAVFRIVQECLTNIHRHSGSAVASVLLSQAGGRVGVRIADQGRGISPEKLAELRSSRVRGVGFRGMQERVRHLGGNWDVQSDGHGTVITVSLPAEQALSAAGS